jgi:hypothetical protein
MSKSTGDLKSIAASGGGMVIDARKYSTADLKSIAASASGKGSRVFVNHADTKSTADLKSIAASGGGSIVFDLS